MNARLRELWSQLTAIFLAQSLRRRIVIVGAGVGSLTAVLAFAWWVQRPLWRPLFTNLSERDAAAIVDALRAEKVPFALEDGGRAVLVPGERLYELRLTLASRGLPEGGGVGFEIFDRQIEFITDAAIPVAMVGLLGALPGTPLYQRLQAAGRLKGETFAGDNQCGYTNIETMLSQRVLVEGYRRILERLYTPEAFFVRARNAIARFPHPASLSGRIHLFVRLFRLNNIGNRSLPKRLALMYRVVKALPAEFRWQSLRFLYFIGRERPELLPGAVSLVVLGLHFCQFSVEHVLPQLRQQLDGLEFEGSTRSEPIAVAN
jgi:hypothetical protein